MAKFKLKAGQKGALIVLGGEILIEVGKVALHKLKIWNDDRKAAQAAVQEQKNDEEKTKETATRKAS